MNKKVTHEIKLEKSVKIILGVLAIGVLVNAFNPKDFGIKDAMAELYPDSTLKLRILDSIKINHTGNIN